MLVHLYFVDATKIGNWEGPRVKLLKLDKVQVQA